MKLCGVLLLSSIPVILCFFWGEDAREKQKRKHGFLLLMQHVRFQIENFQRDQREIFSRFQNPALERIGFLRELLEEIDDNPCSAFERVLKKHLAAFSFSAELNETVAIFAEHFGLQAKKTQLSELNSVIALLEEEEKKEKSEWENRIKILRMSGLTAGLGILILLI